MDVTFSVFNIRPVVEGVELTDLPGKLYKALNKTATAMERLMPLSHHDDNKDKDFISNFNYGQGYLFGSFVRLNEGETSSVLMTSLNKKTIGINEMISEAKEGSAGSIKTSGFFCIFKDILVLSSARYIRSALEIYASWIIREKLDDDMQCRFFPLINTASNIPIRDIQSIKFSDTFGSSDNIVCNTSMKLSKNLLDQLFGNIKTLHDMNIDDLVSATLVLHFNKKELRKNNADVLNKALRLVDSENIIITGKDGRRIRGTEYLSKIVRQFEKIGRQRYNEQAIETEMRNIIKAVKNGEVVS
jgi:hypothetical protein